MSWYRNPSAQQPRKVPCNSNSSMKCRITAYGMMYLPAQRMDRWHSHLPWISMRQRYELLHGGWQRCRLELLMGRREVNTCAESAAPDVVAHHELAEGDARHAAVLEADERWAALRSATLVLR